MDRRLDIPTQIAARLDTVEARWERLSDYVESFGPRDLKPRPAVLLFHGCGGVRGHLPKYAEAFGRAGYRAYLVDSYTPRGWSRYYGMAFVCTAAVFRGWERAGDVAAAVRGVSRLPEVDASRLALAGWSHGGWGIMELLAAPLQRAGEVGLRDPENVDLSGVRAAVLAYPYIGRLALRREAPWKREVPALAIIARKDHLSTVRNAERVYDSLRGKGASVETWIAEGTHSFDEPMTAPPMRFDPQLTETAIARSVRFLRERFGD
jgi:dienelactone hydrolase